MDWSAFEAFLTHLLMTLILSTSSNCSHEIQKIIFILSKSESRDVQRNKKKVQKSHREMCINTSFCESFRDSKENFFIFATRLNCNKKTE